MSTLAEVLTEHLPLRGGTACECGWNYGLSLNDTRSDQRLHLSHLAAVVADWLTSDEAVEVVARELRAEERNASMSDYDWGDWESAGEAEQGAYRHLAREQLSAFAARAKGEAT